MKTKELIEKLQEMIKSNPNLSEVEIETEGCDCDGDVADVIYEEIFHGKRVDKRVYLKRSHHR